MGTLRGPGTQVQVTKARVKLRGLRSGTYTLSLRPSTVTSASYGIKRGATVLPERVRYKVRLNRRTGGVLTGAYGTVVARDAVGAPGKVFAVRGDKHDPKAIVVPRSARYVRGGFVTSGPTKALPSGLVARITRLRERGGKVELRLKSVPVARVVPILGDVDAAQAKTSARRAFGGSKPPGWDIYKKAGKMFPCKVFTGSGEETGELDVGLKNLVLDDIAWPGPATGGFSAHLSGEYSLSATALAPGSSIECSESAKSFSKEGFFMVGVVPIPVYASVSVKGKLSARNTGTVPVALATGMRFEAGVNTLDSDPAVFHGHLDPFLETTGSLTIDVSVNPEISVGVGVRNLVGIKLEVGPELRLRRYTDGTCRADGWLVGTLAWDAVIWKGKPWTDRLALFANKEIAGCALPDPLVGVWESSSDASFKIEPAGGGQFTATAIESSRPGEACQPTPVGATSSIIGANGTYQWAYSWWDYDECRMVERDSAAKLTLDPAYPTTFRLCGRRASGLSSCETWSRAD
ncbi:hypothetical protein [Nocardioides sp.]|uniref:hypothetical protein n=1 Tax=Nocardioides sp. TaxID=35761 RepID=UPI002D8043B6|nr:hypothetical protein [Nocardioides sp.]